jgi:hypothetical protein
MVQDVQDPSKSGKRILLLIGLKRLDGNSYFQARQQKWRKGTDKLKQDREICQLLNIGQVQSATRTSLFTEMGMCVTRDISAPINSISLK